MLARNRKYAHKSNRGTSQRSRRRVLFALAIVACLVFTKVWQKVNVDHQIRRNARLEQELLTLRGETALLEVRIDELRSMQRMGSMEWERGKLVPVPTIQLEEKGMLDRIADKIEDWQRSTPREERAKDATVQDDSIR